MSAENKQVSWSLPFKLDLAHTWGVRVKLALEAANEHLRLSREYDAQYHGPHRHAKSTGEPGIEDLVHREHKLLEKLRSVHWEMAGLLMEIAKHPETMRAVEKEAASQK